MRMIVAISTKAVTLLDQTVASLDTSSSAKPQEPNTAPR